MFLKPDLKPIYLQNCMAESGAHAHTHMHT